jgi:hypothetical protein
MTRARQHVMGVLFLVSGVCLVAGVVNPPLLRTWGDSVRQGVAVAAAHRTAWFTSTWLITLSIAAAVAGVELLTRVLDSDAARVGRSLYLIGAALGLASTAYDLAVTSTLLGTAVLPGWYLGSERWAAGLGTAYFALLAPAALTAFGIAIFRTRALPRWTGVMFLAAALLLFAQYAAFRGALPFPQFLAFIALGATLLIRTRRTFTPIPNPAQPATLPGDRTSLRDSDGFIHPHE